MTSSDTTHPASSGPEPEPRASVTAEGETFPSAPKRLRYVEVTAPAPGTSVAIAPGVRWARIPLPIELTHINVWLLDAADGCVIVDSGMAASMGKDAWKSIAQQVFAERPVREIFITHIHPDHIGLAAWLQEQYRAPVRMSARTHEQAKVLLTGEGAAKVDEAESFLRSHGLTGVGQILPMFRPERFARMASGLPHVERHVADGEALSWGAGEWTAMQTNGHAEGHLCLHHAAGSLLISGDQVLPTISSNISFTFRGGDMNPLDSYLASLQRLRALPGDTLVLPSHGIPFRGLQQRVDDLSGHHHEQLAMVEKACIEPKTAAELLPLMFRRELKGMHLFLALGEALAHLEYLVHAGRAERRAASGTVRYASSRGQHSQARNYF